MGSSKLSEVLDRVTLFTIIMEVFTLMLKRQVNNEKRFMYHWGCKELKIVNFCFIDDLMMFCHGDLISASVLRRAMDEFCLSSGLSPSMTKSIVYFGNVSSEVKEEILTVMPFNEGSLHVRYLGIPLDSNRISRSDCTVLLDKVRKKIENWRNKELSFAGRLQLIASILTPLNAFWAYIFILPSGVYHDIDNMMKSFLWNTNRKKGFKFSVASKEVCKQKNEGGLGLKSLKEWNESLMVKHLWNIISNKDSIWVKWVKTMWLRGDSIWAAGVKIHSFWVWKRILSLSDRVKNFVHLKIRNRKKSFLLWKMEMAKKSECCNYSRRLWERLKSMANLGNVSNSWAQIISSMVNMLSKNTIWSVIQRLILGASIYFIWQERNFRLFENGEKSEDVPFKVIFQSIRVVPSYIALTAFTEEIAAYEQESDETLAVKKQLVRVVKSPIVDVNNPFVGTPKGRRKLRIKGGKEKAIIEKHLKNRNACSLCESFDHNKRRCPKRFEDQEQVVVQQEVLVQEEVVV
ncbi:hypothetical protein Tco_1214016 [Tanacetum coccineum]